MIIYEKLKDRVEFARNKQKLSKTAVAKAIRLSLEGYRAIEDGRTSNPRNKDLLPKVLQVDEGWLFFKNGGVVVYTKSGDTIPVPINHVPLFALDQISEDMEFAKINTNEDMVPMSRKCSLKCYAVVVKGDSMVSPFPGKLSFMEGDVIVIDPDKEPKNGDFVLLKQKNQNDPLFKKYVKEGQNEYFLSLNPEYNKIIKDKITKILGVIVSKQTYFE